MIWLARAAGLLAVFRDPAFPDQGQHILEALAGLRVVAGVGRFLGSGAGGIDQVEGGRWIHRLRKMRQVRIRIFNSAFGIRHIVIP